MFSSGSQKFKDAVNRLAEILSKVNTEGDLFKSEDSVVSTYSSLFSLSNIKTLTDKEFVEFLHIRNNHHWTLMDFQAKNLTQDMNKLRKALLVLLDETRPIEERIDGMAKVKGMGPGIYSPIMLVGTKQKHGVWNFKSEKFLKDLKIMPSTKGKSEGVIYKEIDEILHKLAVELKISLWVLDGLFHLHMHIVDIQKEAENRKTLWEGLSRDVDGGVEHKELSDKKIKRGQRGIFAPVLKGLGERIALSIMITGTRYEDEMGDFWLEYRFPQTQSKQQDENEIGAMISAMHYNLPLFVIVGNKSEGTKRTVSLGLVTNYNNPSRTFLIKLLSDYPKDLLVASKRTLKKFTLTSKTSTTKTANVKTRPNQPQFHFDVITRYGPKCVVCDLTLGPTIEAAHIFPKSKNGSDHEENGLPMCANHHRIFDGHLFTIKPDLTLIYKDGRTKSELLIKYDNIGHLPNSPNVKALEARLRLFKQANKLK